MAGVIVIALGYAGLVAAFGWWGLLGAVLHVLAMLAALPRK